MSDEIKVGDTVERIYKDFGKLKVADKRVVEAIHRSTKNLSFHGDYHWYSQKYFKKVEPEHKKIHPHHDVIIAWLNGATVKYRSAKFHGWSTLHNVEESIRTGKDIPAFVTEWEYEVFPNAEKIEAIRKEMDKLNAQLKELQEEV